MWTSWVLPGNAAEQPCPLHIVHGPTTQRIMTRQGFTTETEPIVNNTRNHEVQAATLQARIKNSVRKQLGDCRLKSVELLSLPEKSPSLTTLSHVEKKKTRGERRSHWSFQGMSKTFLRYRFHKSFCRPNHRIHLFVLSRFQFLLMGGSVQCWSNLNTGWMIANWTIWRKSGEQVRVQKNF